MCCRKWFSFKRRDVEALLRIPEPVGEGAVLENGKSVLKSLLQFSQTREMQLEWSYVESLNRPLLYWHNPKLRSQCPVSLTCGPHAAGLRRQNVPFWKCWRKWYLLQPFAGFGWNTHFFLILALSTSIECFVSHAPTLSAPQNPNLSLSSPFRSQGEGRLFFF